VHQVFYLIQRLLLHQVNLWKKEKEREMKLREGNWKNNKQKL